MCCAWLPPATPTRSPGQAEIALGTVKVHVKSILGKLGAKTRTEAAAVAQRRGLLGQEQDLAPQGASALHSRRHHAGAVASIA